MTAKANLNFGAILKAAASQLHRKLRSVGSTSRDIEQMMAN